MKTNKKNIKLSLIVLVIVGLVSLISSGCSMGSTKSQRLELFISDLMAESTNIGSNFQGHPNANTVNYNFFKISDLSNFYGDLVIESQTVGSSNDFSIDYSSLNTTGGTTQTATGLFHDAGAGGLGGEDWYIYYIVVETVQHPSN